MLEKSYRILVLDDSDLIRVMLGSTLFDLGFKEVDFGEDGAIGFNMLVEAFEEGKPYDLVFTDWSMPNMTGIELLKKCRQNPDFKKIPIVIITAESDSSQVVQALRLGATEFIVKPFSQEALKKKLEKFNKRIVGT